MRLLLPTLLIATIACTSSPTEPVYEAGSVLTLRYGQTATVAGTRVSFADVVADSRCPKDVVCAWAGDAAIRLESGSEHIVLHTNGTAGSATGSLAGLTLTLVEVQPEKISSGEPKKSEYVVSLRVGK